MYRAFVWSLTGPTVLLKKSVRLAAGQAPLNS